MWSWATISSLIQALPAIIRVFQSAVDYASVKAANQAGRAEAISEALTIAADEISKATQVRIEADKLHAKDQTDGAFDDEFKR